MSNPTIEQLQSAKERITKMMENEPHLQYDAEHTLKWLDKMIANTLIAIATMPKEWQQ